MLEPDVPVSVVISTRKRDESFVQRTKKHFGGSRSEMLVYENDGTQSLASIYNHGLNESTHQIVVFMHDDLELETHNVAKELGRLFHNHPAYGIIGLAGTNHLTNGGWWTHRSSLFGQVKHIKQGRLCQINYSASLGDSLANVVCVDGLFIAVQKNRVRKPFNQKFKGFHFYDITFSIDNWLAGVKVGVTTNIVGLHKSGGDLSEAWHRECALFQSEYSFILPLQTR